MERVPMIESIAAGRLKQADCAMGRPQDLKYACSVKNESAQTEI